MKKLPLSRRALTLWVILGGGIAASLLLWWWLAAGRVEDGCNLHQRRCSAPVSGGGRVTLGIEPRPIGLQGPWNLKVSLEDAEADNVEVDIAGVDVPTGFNRVSLNRIKEGRFVGEVTVPVCLFAPIDWQVTVLLRADKMKRAVPFVFNSDPAAVASNAPQDRINIGAPGGGASLLLRADGKLAFHHERGYVTLIFLGYTRAPLTCPQPLAVIDSALGRLATEERERLRVVMVALDPDGDAPAQLQPQLQARYSSYRVMTGADADLIGTANLYGTFFARRSPGTDGKPRIDHSAIFSILDTGGRLVGQLAAQDPERLAGELRKVLGAGATKPISPPQ